MALTVTNIGRSAARNAKEGGFLISFDKFRFTEFDTSSTPSVNWNSLTDTQGAAAYEGRIDSIEFVDASVVRLKLHVPVGYPELGTIHLREVGIYLSSGELFAYGAVSPVYDKDESFALDLYVLVALENLDTVINVTISQNNSLPSSPHVHSLIDPQYAEQNAVIVLDQHDAQLFDSVTTASLALRSGPGGTQWSFVGHDRIYEGVASSVTLDSFIVAPEVGGFWLNDGEHVIAHVIGGNGAGQSRRMSYDKTNAQFTSLTKDFLALDGNSIITIWRSQSNQLPSRTSDLPEYMVLGVGINTYERVINPSSTSTGVTAVRVPGTLDSNGTLQSGRIAGAIASQTLGWVDGVPFLSQIVVNPPSITFGPSYASRHVDVLCLIPTTFETPQKLNMYVADDPADGGDIYHLPVVPDSADWLLVFVDDELVDTSTYAYYESYIQFTSSRPAVGKNVKRVCLVNYEGLDSTVITKIPKTLAAGDTTVSLSSTRATKSDILVLSSTGVVDSENYTYNVSTRQLTIDASVIGYIDVLVVVLDYRRIAQPADVSTSGVNTGPQWIDPAGTEEYPGTLEFVVSTLYGDGSTVRFPYSLGDGTESVRVVVGSTFQPAGSFSYKDGFVTLGSAPAYPIPLDVITIKHVRNAGSGCSCRVENLVGNGGKTYAVASKAKNRQHTMLTIGGAYQHKDSYDIAGGYLIIGSNVPPGMAMELWSYEDYSKKGYTVRVVEADEQIIASMNYRVFDTLDSVNNSWLSIASELQPHNTYALNSGGDYFHLSETPGSALLSKPISSIAFVTALPKTRLILRMEFEGRVSSYDNRLYALENNLAPGLTNASYLGGLSYKAYLRSVNGITPDDNGNVDLPAYVKSVGGVGPDSGGNVALPNFLKSLNGSTPDSEGNLDVQIVKTVNGSSPDSNGNVTVATGGGSSASVYRAAGTFNYLLDNNYFTSDSRKLVGQLTIQSNGAPVQLTLSVLALISTPSNVAFQIERFDGTFIGTMHTDKNYGDPTTNGDYDPALAPERQGVPTTWTLWDDPDAAGSITYSIFIQSYDGVSDLGSRVIGWMSAESS